jgi:hypothetical protein
VSRTKDVTDLIREIEAEGGIVTKTKSGHWKVVNPANRRRINIPATPSEYRSLKNVRTRLRRIGLLQRTGVSVTQGLDPCH